MSKPNHFVPLLKKVTYKKKRQSSLISIPAPKKVKINKIIKHSGTTSAVTQPMFGIIGRKVNLIFLLFLSFHLLPKTGNLTKNVQIFLLHKANSDRM